MSFIIKRCSFYLLAAWASLTINFFLPRLMPGDPAATIFARFQGQLKPEAMEAMRKVFGLTDEPLLKQYLVYLQQLMQGNLGVSIAYFPAPVTEVMASGLAWTILLAGMSVIISFTLGSLLGVLSAWFRQSKLDSILPPLFAFIGAFPYFWLAMLLVYIFGFRLHWFPLGRAYSSEVVPGFNWSFLSSVAYHAFLPAVSIVIATMGGWLLAMRNSMIAVLNTEYIAFAKARGLSERRIMLNYAARNALLPSLTSFGMALGFVLAGSLLTEIVFSYPGQGYLLVQAVKSQDYALMQGIFLTITFAVLGANALVDLLLGILDPTTRARVH